MVNGKKVKFFEGWEFNSWKEAIAYTLLLVIADAGTITLLLWLFITHL